MSAVHSLIMNATEQFGFRFQCAYTVALRAVVLRRRRGCSDTTALFWMCTANEDQQREAFEDAIAVLELQKETL